MSSMEKRKLLYISDELSEAIHKYAVSFHDGNDSAAIRFLLRIGLDAEMNLRYPLITVNTVVSEVTRENEP